MLPQQTRILALMMATLLSLGSLSLIPLDVYASHSYEAGVQGDAIPDNTHIDLSNLTLPSTGVLPLYDSSPNFISGHFLLRAPCDDSEPPKPLVSPIAGHIDELSNLTHVEEVPLFYIGHASTAGSCVYHAHLPDPLEGGSPRITDVDLVNYSPDPVTFNPGDAVDINIQRSLGSIGSFYAGDELLPLELSGNNKVIDLNEDHAAAEVEMNAQKTLGNLAQFKADAALIPLELTYGNNQLLNMNEDNVNDNDNDNNDNDNDNDDNDNDDNDNDNQDENDDE
jgi:hypothetical protein